MQPSPSDGDREVRDPLEGVLQVERLVELGACLREELVLPAALGQLAVQARVVDRQRRAACHRGCEVEVVLGVEAPRLGRHQRHDAERLAARPQRHEHRRAQAEPANDLEVLGIARALPGSSRR